MIGLTEESIGELTEERIAELTEEINGLSRLEVCRLWRFAPVGHPFFNKSLPLYAIFKKRYDELGGFTPAISKQLGWDR